MQEILITIAVLGVLYFFLFKKKRGSIRTTPINYQISTS